MAHFGFWNGVDADAMANAGTQFSSGTLVDISGVMTPASIDFDSMGRGFEAVAADSPGTHGKRRGAAR